MAPAGTPKDIVDKVSRDVAAALKAADMKARFDPQGAELVSSTPEQFGEVVRSDTERYAPLFPKQPGG
ncbi:MAG: tripartite tricarboxylate transporter substrate-binding protein [Pseudomonadota bacterium]|nr:tripartite tricarboxylate transporter substrate-binding protein [Pseudomonadota bacterium]